MWKRRTNNQLQSIFVLVSQKKEHTLVKVDGATPKRWHDKPINGNWAIYFSGGIHSFIVFFFFLTGQDPEQLFTSIDQDVQGEPEEGETFKKSEEKMVRCLKFKEKSNNHGETFVFFDFLVLVFNNDLTISRKHPLVSFGWSGDALPTDPISPWVLPCPPYNLAETQKERIIFQPSMNSGANCELRSWWSK